MGAEVEELTRDRGNSILVHGLPVQQAECLESLVKLMSDLIRTRLGIGREMVLVSVNRLKPTKWVGSWVKSEGKYFQVLGWRGWLTSFCSNIQMFKCANVQGFKCFQVRGWWLASSCPLLWALLWSRCCPWKSSPIGKVAGWYLPLSLSPSYSTKHSPAQRSNPDLISFIAYNATSLWDSVLSYCGHSRTGILITEDMARCTRGQWGELRKFMLKVRDSAF